MADVRARTVGASPPRRRRRSAHEERRAAARLHIVEGLLLAQANADAVVALIRAADAPDDARQKLIDGSPGLKPLSEDQARAVLALTLSRLTSLAAGELAAEETDLQTNLERLRSQLSDDAVVYDVIIDELQDVKKRFATPRRTQLIEEEQEFSEEDVVENDRSAVLVSRGNYVKRTSLKEFAAQGRGGRGRRAAPLAVEHLVTCRDHDTLLCISDAGVAYGVRAFHVPAASRLAKGAPVPQILPVDQERTIQGLLAVDTATLNGDAEGADDYYVVVLTKRGLIKRTKLSAFSGLSARGLIAVRLSEGDAVHSAALCTLADSLVIATASGRAVRYDVTDVKETSRATRGVKGLSLKDDDELVAMDVVPPSKSHVLLLTQKGYGKRVPVDELKARSRTSAGVQAIKFRAAGDALVGVRAVSDGDEVLMITDAGVVVRQAASGVTAQSRTATGVRVQAAAADDACAFLSVVPPDVKLDDAE